MYIIHIIFAICNLIFTNLSSRCFMEKVVLSFIKTVICLRWLTLSPTAGGNCVMNLSYRFFQQDIYFIIYKKVQEICSNRYVHLLLWSSFKLQFVNNGRHFVQVYRWGLLFGVSRPGGWKIKAWGKLGHGRVWCFLVLCLLTEQCNANWSI